MSKCDKDYKYSLKKVRNENGWLVENQKQYILVNNKTQILPSESASYFSFYDMFHAANITAMNDKDICMQ